MKLEIHSYHANGSIAHTSEAISRQKMGEGWIEGSWQINLSNGTNIVINESKVHPCYAGWQDLPEIIIPTTV